MLWLALGFFGLYALSILGCIITCAYVFSGKMRLTPKVKPYIPSNKINDLGEAERLMIMAGMVNPQFTKEQYFDPKANASGLVKPVDRNKK